MQLLLGLERMEILFRAAQLVKEERVLIICQVNDESLLLTGIGCGVQGDLDIQILGELVSVLRPQSHCNLALM